MVEGAQRGLSRRVELRCGSWGSPKAKPTEPWEREREEGEPRTKGVMSSTVTALMSNGLPSAASPSLAVLAASPSSAGGRSHQMHHWARERERERESKL